MVGVLLATAALLASASANSPLTAMWRTLPADRLLLLLDLLPLVLLGGLGLLAFAAWSGREGPGAPWGPAATEPTEREPFRARFLRHLPLAAATLTTAFLVLLATADVRLVPAWNEEGVVGLPGVGALRTSSAMGSGFEVGAMAEERQEEERPPAPGPLPPESRLSVRAGLLLVAALAAAGMAWYGFRRRSQARIASDEDPDGEEADRLAVRGALAGTIQALLADPDPNTAIRGAYASLLAALEARGRGRFEHEGPTEHLQRVLATLRVRPTPLRELIELFELARFSPLALTATHRERALLALRSVDAELEEAA